MYPSEEKSQEKPDVIAAALNHASSGVPVFPVRADKTPLTPRGFKDATTDERAIHAWWRRWPDAGIGIPTGEASGLLVIDSDPRHGGDVSLCALINEHGDLPETLEAATGGGGHHIVFAYPKGSNIRNSMNRLGEGIDVRGEGGYFVAPPSPHASGRRYRWRNDYEPAPVPEWLLRLLTEGKPVKALTALKTSSEARSTAIKGDLIAEGGRNERLFRIACSLRGRGVEQEEIGAELLDINARRCLPPLPAAEVLKIARSAASYSANHVAQEPKS